MPDGMYKVKIRGHDDFDENILTMEVAIEKCKSGILDSQLEF
jgi:hypothetical protein